MSTSLPNRIKAHCNACSGDRTHDVLHTVGTRWQDEEFGMSGGDVYQTIQCCGCEAIKLRHYDWNSEDDRQTITYFPAASSRRLPEWFDTLIDEVPEGSNFVVDLLHEIYVALHNDLTSLATMGVRALLEKVMISLSGDQGTFLKNVKKFEELGHVSAKQRDRLEAILDAGHAAMHRDYAPKRGDVAILLDITEHIIESIYLHDQQIKALRAGVPPRHAKAP